MFLLWQQSFKNKEFQINTFLFINFINKNCYLID